MSLKKIYSLTEAEGPDNTDSSNGVPEPVDDAHGTTPLAKLYGRPKAGFGPTSNGVPTQLGSDNPMAPRNVPVIGQPVDQPTAKAGYGDVTIPNPRPNQGGTATPPKSAGPFSRAPNAPEEPLPDLPLEGASIAKVFGLRQEFSVPRRSGKLLELYSLDEMPRPEGSYGPAVMQMLKWAQSQGGREFSTKDLFRAWREAGGQAHQDDKKAYTSFQNIYRRFIDPRGRGTPEQPLVVVQGGFRGRGGTAVFRWGSVRPSKSAAAKPTPGATPYDDMQLGAAGSPDQGPDMDLAPDEPGEQEPEEPMDLEPGDEQEPDQEPESEPEQASEEDQYDWIPEADPESGVGRAMIALNEHDPDKLQELLAGVAGSDTVLNASMHAVRLYGRQTVMGSHAIKVAKSAAANLGLPDPDGIL